MSEDTAKSKGLGITLVTVFTAVATTILTGYIVNPFFEVPWTHFSEAGTAMAQIGQHIMGPFNDAVGQLIMPLLDGLREIFGITATFAGQTVNGANILSSTANSIPLGSSLGGNIPLLNGGNVPLIGQ